MTYLQPLLNSTPAESEYAISFILPIYNVEKYLAKAIESIIRQPIHKEIILVNDGSTDNSLHIALDYSQRYPFISVIHGMNRGVSAARNRGLALARGEFVLFLDPDDQLTVDADLSQMYLVAKENKANVIKGQCIKMREDEPGKIWKRPFSCPDLTENNAIKTTLAHFFTQTLNSNWVIQIGCFLIEREFLIKNQLYFDEQQNYAEDGLFCIQMYCCEGCIIEVPNFVLIYHQRLTGIMKKGVTEKLILDHYRVVEIVRSKIKTYENKILIDNLLSVLALYSYMLDVDIQLITDQALKEKYKDLITEEMRSLYTSKGIYSRSLESIKTN